MKKLLLLSASALLSLSAMAQVTEPTLTLDWSTQTDVPAAGWGAYARIADGYDNKIYINHVKEGLYCFTGNVTTKSATRSLIAGVSASGCGPSIDSKGNAIILGAYNAAPSSLVLWNAKTSEAKTVTLAFPAGFTAGSVCYLGDAVGDIFGEGGAIFIVGNGNTGILKVYFANGEQVVDKTKVIETGVAADSQTIAVPVTEDPNSDECLLRKRGDKDFYYNDGTEWKQYTSVGNVSTTAGGDAVVLGGVLFTIEPAKLGADNYMDGWQIVERDNNTLVKSVAEIAKVASGGYNTSITAEKVSDTKANIYHVHPGALVAKYTFEIPADYKDALTAIESVAVDANAPVEYYNLQGVKVANPENGLFIKKQGNKATKVIL